MLDRSPSLLNKDNVSYVSPYLPLSPIAQLDGIVSPFTPPCNNLTPPIPPTIPSVRTRNVEHTLDRNKQLKRLKKDTAIPDFEIEVSKSKQNVNIDCNTGFYATVAVPTLKSLSSGQVKVFGDIALQCQDIIGNFDTTKANQTTILLFRLSSNRNSLGSVRIHLHHTTRKVQLQGRTVLPDQRLAPVWFAETVLRDHFISQSREKSADITELNLAVSTCVSDQLTTTQSPQTCGGCKIQFSGRSTPEYCQHCGQYFHKKCFTIQRSHPCGPNKRSKTSVITVPDIQLGKQVCSTNSANISMQATPLDITQHQVAPNASTHSVYPDQAVVTIAAPIDRSVDNTLPPPATASDSVAIHPTTVLVPGQVAMPLPYNQTVPTLQCDQVPHSQDTHNSINPDNPTDHTTIPILPELLPRAAANTGDTAVIESGPVLLRGPHRDSNIPSHITLNPSAPPFVTTNTNPNPEQTQSKTRGKAKKATITTDPSGIGLEFAKTEISTLQAKLQSCETELKDLKFRNTILMERNKNLEETKKKEIHDRYFPPPDLQQPADCSDGPGQQYSARHCSYYHHCGPPAWPQPCPNHNNIGSNDKLVSIDSKLSGLTKSVGELLDLLHTLARKPAASTQDTVSPSTSSTQPRVNTSIQQSQLGGSPISLDGFMFGGNETDTEMDSLN